MFLIDWFNGHFSSRGRAMAVYKRGMAKAKRRDHDGAIDDYTTTIGMANIPADLRAMVLYNRALVHVAAGSEPQGQEDLEAILAMDDAGVNVTTMARQKLARMESRSRKKNGADR